VNLLRAIGLALLLLGVVLQPIGWAYMHWLTPVSFAAIFFGVLLFIGASRELAKDEANGRGPSGRDMPGDIHGYSGQMHGGRSTSWESRGSDGGGAGPD
jgi:hypothetical protein